MDHLVDRPVEADWPRLPQHERCKIAIVGEAPGADEILEGHPFVGSSGHLLNTLLTRAGIDREACLVTNVFRFKPPQNDVQWFFHKKQEAGKISRETGWTPRTKLAGDRGYVKPQWEGELDRLYAELQRARPNVVIALGATSLWALTGRTEISKMRGVCLPIKVGDLETKLVASYHPAYVLRQYDWKPILGMDLVKAKINSEYPEIRSVERNLWINPTYQDLITFENRFIIPQCIERGRPLSFDIETNERLMQMTCIGFSPLITEAIVVPFTAGKGSYWPSAKEEFEALGWCRRLLEDPRITKLAQNGSYDRTWLAARYGIVLKGRYEDTLHLSHAMEPELPKDLATLAALYTNESTAWKLLAPHQTNKDDQ